MAYISGPGVAFGISRGLTLLLIAAGNAQMNVKAFDVEHDTIVRNDAGMTMCSLNIGWILPIGVRGFIVPSFQCFFGIWIRFPEVS